LASIILCQLRNSVSRENVVRIAEMYEYKTIYIYILFSIGYIVDTSGSYRLAFVFAG